MSQSLQGMLYGQQPNSLNIPAAPGANGLRVRTPLEILLAQEMARRAPRPQIQVPFGAPPPQPGPQPAQMIGPPTESVQARAPSAQDYPAEDFGRLPYGTEMQHRPTERLPFFNPGLTPQQAPEGSVPSAGPLDQSTGQLVQAPPAMAPNDPRQYSTEGDWIPGPESTQLPLPPPDATAGPANTDPVAAGLAGLMAPGTSGSTAGGASAMPSTAARGLNIPRPDNNAVLDRFDRSRPPDIALNDREQYMMGLMGALGGIHFQPGQRLGFGLQGAAAGGVEGMGNERLRQRADIRQNSRDQRQFEGSRASLQAQLEGQDYERQVGSARFDQAERFHQDSQSTARAQIAATRENAAATRQIQMMGLQLRMSALAQRAQQEFGLSSDVVGLASRAAPMVAGSAGASQRLTLPPGLGLDDGDRHNLPMPAFMAAVNARLEAQSRADARIAALLLGPGGQQYRERVQQQAVEGAFMGTLGRLQNSTSPEDQRLYGSWRSWLGNTVTHPRSQRQFRMTPDDPVE